MTPAARIQAAIEILRDLEPPSRPAEQIVSAYFRGRRYIGAKDRRAVNAMAYGALRHRARLVWHLEQLEREGAGHDESFARRALLAYLVLAGEESAASLDALFTGEHYAPEPLTDDERALLRGLQGKQLDAPEAPVWVRHEVPAWLMPSFERAFGLSAHDELAALNREAPLDLRCNTLKAERSEALAALAAEGIEARPTPLSPLGLRIEGRRALQGGKAFAAGMVEVQDEGSQLAALLADARPGMAVADLCAGAGGKTLALAAAMAGRGRLLASDIEQARLDRASARFRRAGAGFVERRAVADLAQLQDLSGAFDRVLVDAPCSGSGAWRRQPDARWRLTPQDLARYRAAQEDALIKAAALVRPGGRLVYVTCSLLAEENEEQVQAFLGKNPAFSVQPVDAVWRAVLGTDCPTAQPFLLLTPARHGTDGFFVALLDRREAS